MYRVWEQAGCYFIQKRGLFWWNQVYDLCIDGVPVARCFRDKEAACKCVAELNDPGRVVECLKPTYYPFTPDE